MLGATIQMLNNQSIYVKCIKMKNITQPGCKKKVS